jgi:hypothetical protein
MTVALERRLASFRAARANRPGPTGPALPGGLTSSAAAERLAAALDGEIVRGHTGLVVRLEGRGDVLPVNRERLARLPGQPPPGVPLVCLDTETTGLATASGTIAFLVGLGWWQGARFRQVQLLLPDHAFEPALLDELGAHIPRNGWLVTYNGRTFDWPLLVARYRMARREAPAHAGHLDLLPFVRRVFRHRLSDARLRTVETGILGMHRTADVEGWEIPGRYFDFLHGGAVSPLLDVVRHNDQDVRSLGCLVALLEQQLGDEHTRGSRPPGDLAGLARAYARERRLAEALTCLDAAEAQLPAPLPARDPFGRSRPMSALEDDDRGWWSARQPADFGGRLAAAGPRPPRALAAPVLAQPWTRERILAERARLLKRAGRVGEAELAWLALVETGGDTAIQGWIEVAKLREHRLADPAGALEATHMAVRLVRRRVATYGSLRRLERDLAQRAGRLVRRLDRGRQISSGSAAGLADPVFRAPHRIGDSPGPGLGAPGALDPPQKGAPHGGAEGLEPPGRRGIVPEGRGEIGRDHQRLDVVQRVP